MADDDDKQQLLDYMIQVCRPKDWQISLIEDRLTKRQLAISSSPRYYCQKRLDSVLKGRLMALFSYIIHKCTYLVVKSWSTVSTSNTVVQADYLAIAPG